MAGLSRDTYTAYAVIGEISHHMQANCHPQATGQRVGCAKQYAPLNAIAIALKIVAPALAK